MSEWHELPTPADIIDEQQFQKLAAADRMCVFQYRELERCLQACEKFPLEYPVFCFHSKEIRSSDQVWLGVVRGQLDLCGWAIRQERIRKYPNSTYELIWLIEPKEPIDCEKTQNKLQEADKARHSSEENKDAVRRAPSPSPEAPPGMGHYAVDPGSPV